MSLVDHQYNAAAVVPSGVEDVKRRPHADPVRNIGIVAVGLSVVLAVCFYFNPPPPVDQSSAAGAERKEPGIGGQDSIGVKVVVVAFFVSAKLDDISNLLSIPCHPSA